MTRVNVDLTEIRYY